MKLIKLTDDHYIIVDDSEIKEKSGDWFYSFETGKIYDTLIHHTAASCKKITHSTNIDWNVVYYIPLSEIKELIGEVDVEKKAIKDLESYFGSNLELTDRGRDWVEGYVIGYNQALEDNKNKKYTEEDLKCMFECGRNYQNNAEITFKVSMEYLQSKTEWEVEIVDGKLKLK